MNNILCSIFFESKSIHFKSFLTFPHKLIFRKSFNFSIIQKMEMKPNSPIFEPVFIRLIESFAPHFHKILYGFEDMMVISPGANVSQIIENIFAKFPRDNPQYSKIIQTLTKLSSFDPSLIISDLSNLFLNLLQFNENTPFQVLQSLSLIFKHGNTYHQEILTRFGIYLTSDLICQVLKEYGYNKSCELLTSCGIKICEIPKTTHKLFNDTIIKQWAVIFSFISEANFQLIFEMFQNMINQKEYEYAFFLIQYIRLDCCQDDTDFDFLSKVYNIVLTLQKENKLTNTILKSISNLLQSQKKYCSPLDNLFDLAWNLKNEKKFQCEAIDIICVLFPLLPSKKCQIESFYQDYVLINLNDSCKVKKNLHLFQILIYGNQYDPRWFCWEWGLSPRLHQYSYMKWNSQPDKPLSDPTSFLSIFMRTFFQEADFSVCYQNFCDILLHFAAIDFPYFIEKVLDSFLSVPNTDPRFVSFLMMIPKVNTLDFIDYSSKPVTFSDMGTFNEKVKSKVIDALSVFTAEFLAEHGICSDQMNAIKTMIYDSDRKVEKRLEEWRFSNFQKTVIDHQITDETCKSNSDIILQIHLSSCMPYIIPIEDYDTPEKMRLILQLSFNASLLISSVAYPICQSIITDDQMQIKFIEIILEYIKGPTSCESLFTCINLLNEMLISNPQELPIEVLHNIEFAGIRGSVSVHPSCRLISVKLLKMVNCVLCGRGCFNFVILNIEEIEKVANRRLFSHYLSDKYVRGSKSKETNSSSKDNDSNSNSQRQNQTQTNPSNKLIKFNQAACSHYFDIWLYFVSEIANIIVSVNYVPLLDRFRTNLDCYISTLITANTGDNSNSMSNCCHSCCHSHSSRSEQKAISRAHFYAYPDLSSGDITNLFTPTSSDSQMNVGLLTYYLAAHFDIEVMMKAKNLYKCQLSQPFGEKDGSLQDKVVLTMKKLIHVEGLQKLAFTALMHSHISLYPLLITLLSKAPPDQYENSVVAARIMLLSPAITPQIARVLFKSVLTFVSILVKFLISEKVNSPSIISQWTNEMELIVIDFGRLCVDFCIIIGICLKEINGSISMDEWPLNSRESIFVFMLNWITTKSPKLENLRVQASNTLIRMADIGPMFNHSNLLDLKCIEIISSIEKKHSILGPILYNHVEYLLDIFIDSVYVQASSTSNIILSSLFVAFDAEYSDFLYKKSAPLLLLGFVIHIRKNPQSFEFLSALIDLITQGKLSINSIEALIQMSNEDNKLENGISNMINRYLISSNKNNGFGQSREISSMLLSQMSRSNSSNSISKYTQNSMNGVNSINWIFSKASKNFLNQNMNNDSNRNLNSNMDSNINASNNESISIDRLLNEIAKQLKYATESVFQQGFRILKMKDLRISIKDIIDVLIIWSKNIHLLPNQSCCLQGIPSEFHVFTPYEFLEELMKTTEIVGNTNISSMVLLWASLIRMEDHSNIIPIFLFDFQCPNTNCLALSCRKGNSKQQILARLVSVEPENAISRMASNCSFAYYYYVTVCLKKSFEDELWIVPLLIEAFQTSANKEKLISLIPSILHFAFIFMDKGTGELLRVLCNAMNIEIPDVILSHDILISIVKRFVTKFKETKMIHIKSNRNKNKIHHDSNNKSDELTKNDRNINDEDCIETWGTEVVKWILGSTSLHYTTFSLIIFNQILRPIEPLVISGVCKAIIYHINKNRNDISALSVLIHESFVFYASIFEGNEKFAFSYTLSFIDCRLFVDNCLDKAAKLFIKCMMSPKTRSEAWNSIISMIRPFISKLETDKKTQKLFEVLIKNHASEELLMIVLPIHLCHGDLFKDCLNDIQLLNLKNKNQTENSNENVDSKENKSTSYIADDCIFDSKTCNDQVQFNLYLETVLLRVSEETLNKSLAHYSRMITTASPDLMNSIFIISTIIVNHISVENSKEPLRIIYKYAVESFPSCPNSIDFISAIVRFNLTSEKKNFSASFDWERSIDCVLSSLNSLIQKDHENELTVTDCNSIQSVYNLLNSAIVPKILPFAKQKEMIEEMKSMVKNSQNDVEQQITKAED